MAKAKTSKARKKKQQVEYEVFLYIYGFIAITLSIIGALKIGPVGQILTGIITYLFGTLYGIVYLIIIVACLLAMMKKNIKQISLRVLLGIGALLVAWIMLASLSKDESKIGLDVLSSYMGQSSLIFKGEVAAGGGLVGALLLSFSTFLFDYLGTKIVIGAFLILGIFLLCNEKIKLLLKSAVVGFSSPIKKAKEKNMHKEKKQTTKEKNKSVWDEESDSSILGKINIDDRVSKGQVSFLDVDRDFDIETHESYTEKEVAVNKEAEEKAIIEDIIGMEDTFVSEFSQDYTNYRLPKLSLLSESNKKGKSVTNVHAAKEAGRRLIELLDQFGVKATLIATHIGPSVTKFEIRPDLGVRVNKISNLQNDIKMALAAKDIRIEAPIPGKSSVGIEIPNAEKTSVGMKDVMRQIPERLKDSKLAVALGKDLMGNVVFGELNKMPHLLIAGATGSGKSVCVNSIITSILLRAKPDEVKLLLVDPKKVEFTPYKEIPHLLGPVITDGEEANRALKVIVAMMDQRYELFSMAGVRNIAGYNEYILKHPEDGLQPLPWIVVIIDELADLMLVAAKEVESSIQRITQLARAAGIHLIVATQRPSVDVITGIIKANIPSRIAFAVSSAVDSRTILDQQGAEKLLGYGDMLYVPVGETAATRVQGVFVSEEEVARICEFVSSQAKAKFEDAFLRLEACDSINRGDERVDDPLYDEVKDFIVQTRKASTSLIQRKFSIGYSRAARLIDILEERGIIGPARGSKPREVYIKNENHEEEGV